MDDSEVRHRMAQVKNPLPALDLRLLPGFGFPYNNRRRSII
jgi:hypothetical protein